MTIEIVVLGALAHLTAALTGVTIGALVSPPTVTLSGFAMLLAALATVVLIATPHLPPVRFTLEILERPRGLPIAMLAGITAATGLAAALVTWATGRRAARLS